MMALQENRITSTLALFLCLIFTTIIYSPGLSGDFSFDDFPNIVENTNIQINSVNYDSLITASLSSNSGVFKRPISMLSFALNHYFFGQKPYSYKIVNLIIHLLTGIGLFILTKLILHHFHLSRQLAAPERLLFWLPIFVSFIWLVHPLNLTSVLYIVQRMTSLSSLFMVFGACAYVWSRDRQLQNQKGFWLVPSGIVIFGCLAIFSKESGSLFPLFLFLIEVTLFRFRNNFNNIDYKIVAIFSIILLLPALGVVGSLIFKPHILLGSYTFREFTLTERLMTEARVLIFYLKLIILPSTSELGLFHDDIPISRSLVDPVSTIVSITVLSGLFFLGLKLIRKFPIIGFGILWFFAAHALESTIIPLELTHEHRNYLADYGIILSLSYLLFTSQIFLNLNKAIRYTSMILFFGIISTITSQRAYQWSDNVLHAIYEAKHHPESQRSVFAAGRIYFNLTIYTHADKSEDALRMLEKSRLLNKIDILPNVSLILLSYQLGLPIKKIWLDDARKKLQTLPIRPTSTASLKELSKCQSMKRCKLSNEEMKSLFEHALTNTSAHNAGNRHTDILTIYAYYVLNNNKDYKLGYSLFKEAIMLSPETIQYRINLIDLLLVIRQYDEARAELKFIKENNPLGKYNDIIKAIEDDIVKLSTKR